jgi:hypothetical protein
MPPLWIPYFYNLLYEPCVKGCDNSLTCATGGAEKGYVRIYEYTDPIAYKLAKDYNLTNLSEVLFDKQMCGIDHSVYKLARRSDKTNILVLTDDQEF